MATEINPAPVNGAAAAAELERRRALDRERNKRFRERQRLRLDAAVGPAPPKPSQGAGAGPTAGSPPVHETRRLDDLGGDPAAWVREAPHIEHEAPAAPDPEGAKKFAALVALVFRVALDDALPRYHLGHFAGELGAGELEPDQVDAVRAAAVRFVYEHAERCALKHGFGVSVPWEDELVTLGAGAGGALYLVAKFTGRLDRTSTGRPARQPIAGGPAAHPTAAADDDLDSDFAALRVERAES
jgi:hypothetical protein